MSQVPQHLIIPDLLGLKSRLASSEAHIAAWAPDSSSLLSPLTVALTGLPVLSAVG